MAATLRQIGAATATANMICPITVVWVRSAVTRQGAFRSIASAKSEKLGLSGSNRRRPSNCRAAERGYTRRRDRKGAVDTSQRGFRSGVLAASTPWLVRSDRPSSIVAPNRHITKMEIRRRRRRPHHRPEAGRARDKEHHRAAQAKKRRAGFLGHHPPRDKEHHSASRKCRRESTPQTGGR